MPTDLRPFYHPEERLDSLDASRGSSGLILRLMCRMVFFWLCLMLPRKLFPEFHADITDRVAKTWAEGIKINRPYRNTANYDTNGQRCGLYVVPVATQEQDIRLIPSGHRVVGQKALSRNFWGLVVAGPDMPEPFMGVMPVVDIEYEMSVGRHEGPRVCRWTHIPTKSWTVSAIN